MRTILLPAVVLLSACGLSACGERPPERVASDAVVENAADPGAAWPLMLAHCRRSPHCDPTTDFGQGVGQASNLSGAADWFAETKDAVKEGGEDYGGAITISVYGTTGRGGPAGRPLSDDEGPDSLKGMQARRSTISIEYRTPGGGAPEPYGLQLRSAWLALAKDADEAKLEITGKAGVLFSADVGRMGAGDKTDPVVFFHSRNLRDEPLPALLAALDAGETLGMQITTPDGIVLQNAVYAVGFNGALQQATGALADPEIARPVIERCDRFAKEPEEFWKIADVTPALMVCDPRSIVRRRLDER
jgi:hypothetical protein